MGSKPKVVVARKQPEAVDARTRLDYVPLFNSDDLVHTSDELADGADFIAQLRGGAIGVNTARGAPIVDGVLQAAQRTGHTAAAGLDAFIGESSIHPGLCRVRQTISAAVHRQRHAGDRPTVFRALEDLDAAFAGREPVDRVAWRSHGAVHGGTASLNCWYIAYKNPSKAPAQADRRG